jgi:hypothetical protein
MEVLNRQGQGLDVRVQRKTNYNEIAESAMQTRERDPLRRPGA